MRPILVAALALAGAALGSGCSLPAVDGVRALARVERQCASGPRIPGSEAHARVADWIAAELRRLGGRVERQAFVDSTLGRPVALVNIIGHFGPDGDARILFCAHWDSRPVADQDPDSSRRREPVPGANDGASGVAVLLELAEAMHQKAPAVGVDLVFFDGEDMGEADKPEEFCLGSRHYARTLEPPRPKAAFLVDMVGDRDLEIHPEMNSVERAANLVDEVLEGARRTGGAGFRTAPRHRLYDDHIPLLLGGIPAVDIIDFDYPYWHTASDTPDKVSAQSLAQVARVLVWLAYKSPLAHMKPPAG
jgi:peptidase M28-like protein